jgi:predicted HicB family RNase H-like nuclease
VATTIPVEACYPAAMKRFDLRLPDELHERVVALAQRERRSVHAQILRLIEEGLERAEAAHRPGGA